VKENPRAGVLLYSLIAVMVLLWSANFIVGKIALRQFPPLLLGGLRVSFAGLFLLPLYIRQAWREGTEGHRADAPLLLALGVVGVALNQLLFVLGLSRTTVSHSAVFIGLTPLFVILIAAAMKQEKVTARRAAGMAISLAGVAILNGAAQSGAASPSLSGDVLVILAALTFAWFTVVGKGVGRRQTSITVNTFAYVGAAVAFLPLILWQSRDFDFRLITPAGWVTVAYMALFPSVICYLIYYWALTKIPASKLSAFTYLQPVLTTLMGMAVLGEQVSANLVAGGTVIVGGVYLAERS
jgi:drug/metabolite transporter (DMT)-like permease